MLSTFPALYWAQILMRSLLFMPYYVYIIQSELDGTYYIGSTQGLDERIQRHNEGRSKYSRAKAPWKLVYYEEHPSRSAAMKRENRIKRQKRTGFIEKLVKTFQTSFGSG